MSSGSKKEKDQVINNLHEVFEVVFVFLLGGKSGGLTLYWNHGCGAGPEYAAKYKTLIYLSGSASAEIIADIAMCPMEAVKVRVPTKPGFARDTMMKFASFETIVELLYKHAIPTPKDQCSGTFQLAVSFGGGYLAGVFCAIVSTLLIIFCHS
ncbi:hypothetical protein QQ045_003360 [Rhodiola kirilowii]